MPVNFAKYFELAKIDNSSIDLEDPEDAIPPNDEIMQYISARRNRKPLIVDAVLRNEGLESKLHQIRQIQEKSFIASRQTPVGWANLTQCADDIQSGNIEKASKIISKVFPQHYRPTYNDVGENTSFMQNLFPNLSKTLESEEETCDASFASSTSSATSIKEEKKIYGHHNDKEPPSKKLKTMLSFERGNSDSLTCNDLENDDDYCDDESDEEDDDATQEIQICSSIEEESGDFSKDADFVEQNCEVHSEQDDEEEELHENETLHSVSIHSKLVAVSSKERAQMTSLEEEEEETQEIILPNVSDDDDDENEKTPELISKSNVYCK